MAYLQSASLIPVGEIMRVKKSIPHYQRDFVWEDSLVSSFLENIYEAFKDNKDNKDKASSYFTGSMVFYKTKYKDVEVYEIVDGQQRITVLYIFISEILKKLEELLPENSSFSRQEKATYIFSESSPGKIDYSFIHRTLNIRKYLQSIGDGKTDAYRGNNDDVRLESLKSCEEIVKDFVKYVIEENSKHEKLLKFYRYILDKVTIIPYLAADINEALLIYSRLNSGGKALGHLEIIKGQLFGEIGDASPNEWDELEECWEEFWKVFKEPIKIGGFLNLRPLIPEDTFISYYFFVKHPELVKTLLKGSDGFLPTNKISNFLTHRDLNKKMFSNPIEFVQDLIRFTKGVRNLRVGEDSSDKIKNTLKDIALLSQTQTQPLMFLLSCLNHNILNEQIVDRVFYLVFIFSMSVTGSGSTSFVWKNLANAVNSNDKNLKNKKDKVINLVIENIDEEISKFWGSHFENLFETIRIDKAKKKTKTILSVLEMAMRRDAKIKGMLYYNDFIDKEGLDIDHLHPQTINLGSKLEKEEQEKIIQSIGNAAFLDKSDNRALQNKPFNSLEKQDALRGSEMFGTKSVVRDGDSGVKRAAVLRISKATKMNADEIETRKKEMLAILKEFVGAS